jgi:hypothetical protein
MPDETFLDFVKRSVSDAIASTASTESQRKYERENPLFPTEEQKKKEKE